MILNCAGHWTCLMQYCHNATSRKKENSKHILPGPWLSAERLNIWKRCFPILLKLLQFTQWVFVGFWLSLLFFFSFFLFLLKSPWLPSINHFLFPHRSTSLSHLPFFIPSFILSFWMRPRISIRRSVRLSVRLSVRRSVTRFFQWADNGWKWSEMTGKTV